MKLYLGWQYATPFADPGPPPRRPAPPERDEVSAAWLAAQRREESRLNRPLRAACGLALAALLLAVLGAMLGWLGPVIAVPVAACACLVAVACLRALWHGQRALRGRVAAEQRRSGALRAAAEQELFAAQASHAALVGAWQQHRLAFDQQKRWYAVRAPATASRVDIAGGTIAGWTALLATSAAFTLAAGGEVTVLDLTGAAAGQDLLAYAAAAGADPGVWVLPGDLPSFGLVPGLRGRALADVLAAAACAEAADPGCPADHAILDRVIDALGGDPPVAAVTAALRALGQIGDPAADVAAGLLTAAQADQVRVMFGRSAADRVVIERAWRLEPALRVLDRLGTGLIVSPGCNPRVIAVDRQAGPLAGRVLGAYLVAALTHALRADQLVYLLGAETLPGDLIDRLTDACEVTGAGLVLGYRSLPTQVRQRLGRGDAVVALMRLGNADDAKAAAEQIGTEHRFVLAQLTQTLGNSVSDSGSYTSTTGRGDSLTRSRSVSEAESASTGRSRTISSARSHNVQESKSSTTSTADSIAAGLSASTSWGTTTARTGGSSESSGLTAQRSREFLVEPHELQRLPASAMIVSYAGPSGREVILTDVNPGIGGLGSSTMLSLTEAQALPSAEASAGASAGADVPPPNLGPPPERLDWRRKSR